MQSVSERRKSSRLPGNFATTAVIGGETIGCTVLDFSTGGAKLLFPNTVVVPNHFELAPVYSARQPVRVVRRAGGVVAVIFE